MLSTLGIPIAIVGLAITVFATFVFFARNYRKCSPNEVLVVYGRRKEEIAADGKRVVRGYRLITGGATFVFPVLESYTRISLQTFKVDAGVQETPNIDGVLVMVDAVANIKISSDPSLLAAAVERLLVKSEAEIVALCKTTLEGLLRQIIGTLTIEEIVKEREKISHQVLQIAMTELNKLGFVIDNFVILRVHDSTGYIEALGKRRTAEVKRDAIIGEAEAHREATIKSSFARREAEEKRLANEAEVLAAERNLALKQATFKRETETAQAEANLAKDLKEAEIKQDLMRRKVAVEEAEVKARIAVAEQEVMRREKELQATTIKPAEAEREAVTIRAEAEKSATIIRAEAQSLSSIRIAEATRAQADAEKAKLIAEGEGNAQAEAAKLRERGRAEADASRAKGEAEGAAIQAKGEAEGAAIQAKLVAEAEGMRKKQEALARMSPEARMIITLELLPDIIDRVGSAGEKVVGAAFEHVGAGLSRIDSLHILDMGGNGTGTTPVARVGLAAPEIVFQFIQKAKALGLDFEGLLSRIGISADGLLGAQVSTRPAAGKETAEQQEG